MTTPTKIIWHQSDRETPMAQARRTIMQAEATLESLWAVFDAQLDPCITGNPLACLAVS